MVRSKKENKFPFTAGRKTVSPTLDLSKHQNKVDIMLGQFSFALDADNKVIYISPSAQSILGYSKSEFKTVNFFEASDTESRNAIAGEFLYRKKNPKSTKTNTLYISLAHKTGKLLRFKALITPNANAQGAFNGLFITCVQQEQENPEGIKEHLELYPIQNHMETTSDFIWFLNNKLQLTFLNPAFKHQFHAAFGIKLEKGMSIIDTLPVLEKEKWKDRYSKALNGEIFDCTDHIELHTLSIFIETSFSPIVWKKKVVGVACLSRDITKRVKAQEAAKETEMQFKNFFHNSRSSISIQTKSNFLLVNKSWERITGYTKEEAKHLNPIDIVAPDQRQIINKNQIKRFKGKNNISEYDFDIISKDGKRKRINVNIQSISYKNQKASLVYANLVNKPQTIEKELQQLSMAMAYSPTSIMITNRAGEIEYVNPHFTKFTGYTLNEVMGKNPRILKSNVYSKKQYKKIWDTILSGNVWQGEFENVKKNGDIYFEWASIAPIKNEKGEITNFIAIKEDITKDKKQRERLKKSERDLRFLNSKKDKFFSIIAHDLRSPLGTLLSLTQLLKSEYKDMDEGSLDRMLGEMEKSASNVFKLMENLLHWAKSQSGRTSFIPANICLNDLIDKTLELMESNIKQKNIHIAVNTSKKVWVYADENMTLAVIRNLVSNAIKYSLPNGHIQINISEHKKDVEVEVRDYGVGIPLKDQEKLFKIEENYTTLGTNNEKGTGLGLILCKEFIEQHKGKLWSQSEANKGTSFFFTLPAAKKRPQQ